MTTDFYEGDGYQVYTVRTDAASTEPRSYTVLPTPVTRPTRDTLLFGGPISRSEVVTEDRS
jgi:hypothetical protein